MVHDMTTERYPVALRVARLYTDKPFTGTGGDLRRAITACFPDNPLLHHHGDGGRFRYSMPDVRFLVIDKTPCLVGLRDGMDMVEVVAKGTKTLKAGRKSYTVTGHDFIEDRMELGIGPGLNQYTSRSPWLALNQKNTTKFFAADEKENETLLESILTGNFLSLAKNMEITIRGRVLVKLLAFAAKKVITPNPMRGFEVSFVSNMLLPEFLGLGKMVSKGFGLMAVN